MKTQRNLVDRPHVRTLDHAAEFHVAEERNLALDVVGDRSLRAHDEQIGLDSDFHEIPNGVLRRLCLELARGRDERHEREMDEDRVLAPDVVPELPNGFQERQ